MTNRHGADVEGSKRRKTPGLYDWVNTSKSGDSTAQALKHNSNAVFYLELTTEH